MESPQPGGIAGTPGGPDRVGGGRAGSCAPARSGICPEPDGGRYRSACGAALRQPWVDAEPLKGRETDLLGGGFDGPGVGAGQPERDDPVVARLAERRPQPRPVDLTLTRQGRAGRRERRSGRRSPADSGSSSSALAASQPASTASAGSSANSSREDATRRHRSATASGPGRRLSPRFATAIRTDSPPSAASRLLHAARQRFNGSRRGRRHDHAVAPKLTRKERRAPDAGPRRQRHVARRRAQLSGMDRRQPPTRSPGGAGEVRSPPPHAPDPPRAAPAPRRGNRPRKHGPARGTAAPMGSWQWSRQVAWEHDAGTRRAEGTGRSRSPRRNRQPVLPTSHLINYHASHPSDRPASGAKALEPGRGRWPRALPRRGRFRRGPGYLR